jgi:hypothetical protein
MVFYKRRKWIENYSRRNTNRRSYIDDTKALKAELAKLLEDAKYDKFRSLPFKECNCSKFVSSQEFNVKLGYVVSFSSPNRHKF